jgi:hypothetical protein
MSAAVVTPVLSVVASFNEPAKASDGKGTAAATIGCRSCPSARPMGGIAGVTGRV